MMGIQIDFCRYPIGTHPISMAHKENNICLYRFSFIYVMSDLWEGAYTCPIYAMNCTAESAIYVMELTVMGWVPIG